MTHVTIPNYPQATRHQTQLGSYTMYGAMAPANMQPANTAQLSKEESDEVMTTLIVGTSILGNLGTLVGAFSGEALVTAVGSIVGTAGSLGMACKGKNFFNWSCMKGHGSQCCYLISTVALEALPAIGLAIYGEVSGDPNAKVGAAFLGVNSLIHMMTFCTSVVTREQS